jgi:hypothetical protein
MIGLYCANKAVAKKKRRGAITYFFMMGWVGVE